MKNVQYLVLTLLLAFSLVLWSGCARDARNTQGFAQVDSATISLGFEPAWSATKEVLREMNLEIYTRDKRGVFVAYTPMKRRLFVPHRTQYTVELVDKGEKATAVTVETINQVYGVTLLTYPGWHDRKTTNNAGALDILKRVQAKASGGPAATSEQAAPSTS